MPVVIVDPSQAAPAVKPTAEEAVAGALLPGDMAVAGADDRDVVAGPAAPEDVAVSVLSEASAGVPGISEAARTAMEFVAQVERKKIEVEQLLANGLRSSSGAPNGVALQFAGDLRSAAGQLDGEIGRVSPLFLQLLKEDYRESFRLGAAVKDLDTMAKTINQKTLDLQCFVAPEENNITLRGLDELLRTGKRLVKDTSDLSTGFADVKRMSDSDEIAKDPRGLAQVFREKMQTTVTDKDILAIQRGFYNRVLAGTSSEQGSEVLVAALRDVPQLQGKKKGCCGGSIDTLGLVREVRDNFVGLMQLLLRANVDEVTLNRTIREFLNLLSGFQGVVPAQVLLKAESPDPSAYLGLFGVWSHMEISSRGVVGMCARAPKDALLTGMADIMRREVADLQAVMQCLAVFCKWLDDEQKWTDGVTAFKRQLEEDKAALTHGTSGDKKAQDLADDTLKAVGDTLANVQAIKTRLRLFSENKGGIDGIDALQAVVASYQKEVSEFNSKVEKGCDASLCGGLARTIKNLHDCLESTKGVVARIYGEFPDQWAEVARERQGSVGAAAADRIDSVNGARVNITPIFDRLIGKLDEQLAMLEKGSTIAQVRGTLPVVSSPIVGNSTIDESIEKTTGLLTAIQEALEVRASASP